MHRKSLLAGLVGVPLALAAFAGALQLVDRAEAAPAPTPQSYPEEVERTLDRWVDGAVAGPGFATAVSDADRYLYTANTGTTGSHVVTVHAFGPASVTIAREGEDGPIVAIPGSTVSFSTLVASDVTFRAAGEEGGSFAWVARRAK